VAVDSSGNIYIADTSNHVVRRIASGGTITTVAGNNGSGTGYTGDGAAATSASLNQPLGVAADASGNLYIADYGNHCIRKVASGGTISTFAGVGAAGYDGDGGKAASAHLSGPRGVAVDAAGNVYIADSLNHVIRMVKTDGTISTVAGNGVAGFSGDLGPATRAMLNLPRGVAVDAGGNIYIADYFNSRIRKVSPNGAISTIAGDGRFTFAGDGGPAARAALKFPLGIAAGADGRLFVADTQNQVIRSLTPDPASAGRPSVTSGGISMLQDFGGAPVIAPGGWVEIRGSNLSTATRTWSGAFDGGNAPTLLGGTSVKIGGQAAFLSYVSPSQVNAQVPSNVAPGQQTVTVSTLAGAGDAAPVEVRETQPLLLAPARFQIGGRQHAVALHADGGTYVAPAGLIEGAAARPAKPGDTITLFGIGFGAVSPAIAAGQLVQQTNHLVSAVEFSIGGLPAPVSYAGLAQGAMGLYQFNLVVPQAPAGDATLSVKLTGAVGVQTLYLAVGN
jgi:uncharacterized protein (TIGR03437 family)